MGASLVLTGLLQLVFTRFIADRLFEGKEHLLPTTTRFLMMTSYTLRHFWWVYIAGITGLVFFGIVFSPLSA